MEIFIVLPAPFAAWAKTQIIHASIQSTTALYNDPHLPRYLDVSLRSNFVTFFPLSFQTMIGIPIVFHLNYLSLF